MFKIAQLPYPCRLYHSPSAMIATWFGSGLIKPASGTWGTLAAMPVVLYLAPSGVLILCLWAVIITAIGTWAAHEFEEISQEHDSGRIVIDEVAGVLIAAIPYTIYPSWEMAVAVFALFRLFDAWKIGIVGWFDRHINGAVGVMLDDIAAGFMTAIVLLIWMLLWI